MSDSAWEVVEEKECWASLRDPEGWWDAFVRFDGCINLTRRFNAPYPDTEEDDTDEMHVCDLNGFIERLIELRAIAGKKFPDEEGLRVAPHVVPDKPRP